MGYETNTKFFAFLAGLKGKWKKRILFIFVTVLLIVAASALYNVLK